MKVSISFLGDISFNDEYVSLFNQNINPFEMVFPILSKQDFVIGNLECMAKGDNGYNAEKKPRLTTTVETLEYLKKIPINITCLAHNHVYDHLESGFEKTTNYLCENNINYIGASLEQGFESKPIIIEKNGIKIGFLNYVTPDTNPKIPLNSKVFLNLFNFEKAISDISLLKNKCNQIVLLMHWGGRVEGGYYPDWQQPGLAHKLIDSGADLIIGSHTHTVQPLEIYKQKHIFYSLGNFCFADVHSDGKIKEIEWGKATDSMILNVEFTKQSYTIDLITTSCKNLHVKIDSVVKQKWQKRQQIYKIVNSFKFLWNLYFFKHTKIDPLIFFFFGNNHHFFSQLSTINLQKIVNFVKR